MVDQAKYIDKSKLMTAMIDVSLTYDSALDSSVRLHICKSGESETAKGHRGRVHDVNEKNIANPKELKLPYTSDAVSTGRLPASKPYTAVLSAYKRADPLGGTLTLESDVPMVFQMLHEEGTGF
jgi:hypothetical protein